MGNITTRSGGEASSLAAARESAQEDEEACEARGIPKRRIEHSVPDGGASDTTVRYKGVQLQCADEETQSLLFSCNPRAAASGNVLDLSGSKENAQQLRSFEIDPAKHKIFLSHSGAQKNFVEQLCIDLEARGYLFPFFDQRYHSLPEGKDFAPLIKQTAQLCHVAVIVLSEEFLCSKWPMIELVEFHAAKQGGNCRMSMLPLFYKLKVGDLDDESIESRWMPVWNELASRDKRIDVSECAAAVRALRGVKGLPFGKHSNSEVGYRKEIVRSIWKMSPGDLLYDSAQEMVGYDRICERVSKDFVECNSVGASVLGLYGTSGVGKTTVAKALCDYFAGEFEGRVCHVELGAKTKMKRQEWMLKALCGVEDDLLNRLPDDRKGLKLMRDLMNREPVLLVLDNLTNDESSRREAHEYLMVGFHPRSKVMITARSKEVLQDLVPGVEFCMSIPKLNSEEAGMIFLRSAAPMRCFSSVTDEERRVLRLCVEKCLLGSDGFRYLGLVKYPDDSLSTDVPRYGAYHPLALSALGDYFYRLSATTEVLQWKDSLDRDHELMRDVLQSPSITSIICLQFSTFSWSERLLFLDLAFYLYNNYRHEGVLHKERRFKSWVERLALMHGARGSVVEKRLQDLKRSGMIDWENVDDQDFEFIYVNYRKFEFHVHSLYREFAEWYVIEHGVTGLKNAGGVFQPCCTNLGSDHQGSKRISDLVRLRVFEIPRANILTCKRMRELQNLVLLQLNDCTNLQVLSLAGLDNLCHLELIRLPQLVTVTLIESSGTHEDGGIFESLLYVLLEDLASLTYVPDLRSCTSLRLLEILKCVKVTNFVGVECPHVTKLSLRNYIPQQLERQPNFRSLHCLTELYINLEGYFDIGDAIDLASPFKLKPRRREQCVALENIWDKYGERTIIYIGQEKQFVKEGLSIVQNVLSYLYTHGWDYRNDKLGNYLSWIHVAGDKEELSVYPCHGCRVSTIQWRCRSPKDYFD